MTGFWRRFVRVLLALLPFAFAFLRDRRRFLLFGRARTLSAKRHEHRARRLRDRMLELGPAFIKIGQVLSTRPDLVPPVYAEELATLQDTVPEDVGEDPRDALRGELGDLFGTEPDLEPVAGGSLAYVYETTYRGERVAVKIRRPGVKDRIQTDLAVIRKLVPVVAPVVPSNYEFSLRNLADDFESVVLEELDFRREAQMMNSITANFEGDDRVRIPRVHEEASTERVLTMEFVDGQPVTDHEGLASRGVEPAELADRIARVYLEMGLKHGTFHADPHPGNLAVDDEGRLVIYDFGMSRRLDRAVQASLIGLYRGLATRNPDKLMAALIDLGALEPTVDRAEVREVLSLVIETLEGGTGASWTVVLMEVVDSLREFPFRIPPDVMLLIRVGTVSEGVCRSLDPEFDFVRAARSFLVEEGHMESGLEELYTEVRTEATEGAWSLLRTPAKLERTLDRLDDERLVLRARVEPKPLVHAGRVVGLAILAGSFGIVAALLSEPHPEYALASGVFAGLSALAFLVSSRNR